MLELRAPVILCRPNPEWYIAADMFLNVPWPAWYETYLQLHARARGAPDALAESGGAGAAAILRETAGLFDGACAPLHVKGPPVADLHLTLGLVLSRQEHVVHQKAIPLLFITLYNQYMTCCARCA